MTQPSENTPLLEESKRIATEAQRIREKLAEEAKRIQEKTEQEKKEREQKKQMWVTNKPNNIETIKDLQIIFSDRQKKVLDEYKEMEDDKINELWDVQFLQRINTNIEKILSQNLDKIPAGLIQAETECLIAQNNLYNEINENFINTLVQAEKFLEEQKNAFLSEHPIDDLSPSAQYARYRIGLISATVSLGSGIIAASAYGISKFSNTGNELLGICAIGVVIGAVIFCSDCLVCCQRWGEEADVAIAAQRRNREQIAWCENVTVKESAQLLLSHSHFIVQRSQKLLEEKKQKYNIDLEQQQPGDEPKIGTPGFALA